MESDLITFLRLAAIVVVWWFAVQAVAGERFGIFHWIPVGIAAFGVPVAIADLTFQYPRVSVWFFYGWNLVGLALTASYFIRRRIRPSTAR